jgi:hypothetical protein
MFHINIQICLYLLSGREGWGRVWGIETITITLQKAAQARKRGLLQVYTEWTMPGNHVSEKEQENHNMLRGQFTQIKLI